MASETTPPRRDASTIAGLTSLVIVAADSGPLLLDCVARALEPLGDLEVIVIDNASSDGMITALAAAHADDSRLAIVPNPRNIGFGPACNQGAALARGDLLVFVNPDCVLPAGFIKVVRASLASRIDIGLLGMMVCEPDGRPARGNRRRDPMLRRALASMSGLARFEARWPAFAGVEMPHANVAAGAIEDVEAVSGACIALPRAVFERVNGFDERYFLHVEDLDLCRRVRDAGFAVAIAHAIRVVHARGSSSHHRPVFVARHKHAGMWRYFCAFDPAARHALVRALVWLGLWGHFSIMLPWLVLRKWRSS